MDRRIRSGDDASLLICLSSSEPRRRPLAGASVWRRPMLNETSTAAPVAAWSADMYVRRDVKPADVLLGPLAKGCVTLLCGPRGVGKSWLALADRKSTRLNSSHSQISYAVFCLK